jgi:hypothetical protein
MKPKLGDDLDRQQVRAIEPAEDLPRQLGLSVTAAPGLSFRSTAPRVERAEATGGWS